MTNGVVTGTAQCAATSKSSGAQVYGEYTIGTRVIEFTLQCGSFGDSVAVNENTGGTPTFQTVDDPDGTRTLFIEGVQVAQVFCAPAAAAYPLAVDVGGASGAAPAVVQTSSSGESSGLSTTVLLLAGAAAIIVAGQLVIGRRLGNRRSGATG